MTKVYRWVAPTADPWGYHWVDYWAEKTVDPRAVQWDPKMAA